MRRFLLSALGLVLLQRKLFVLGWIPPTATSTKGPFATTSTPIRTSRSMNLLDNIGDLLTGGALVPQTDPLPYGKPLAFDPLSDTKRTFAIQERLLSWTGEDFDVNEISNGNNSKYLRVRGAMLHLPGKDKMKIVDSQSQKILAVLSRRLLVVKPTYDIYRGDCSEKLGWIEKASFALTDTFEVHIQNAPGGFGPMKPPAAYKLEGDFLDRRFVVKNAKNQVVAKVSMDQLIEFDVANHYQVQVAAGMDPVLILACACAIDEEFDEEHRKRKRQEQQEQQ